VKKRTFVSIPLFVEAEQGSAAIEHAANARKRIRELATPVLNMKNVLLMVENQAINFFIVEKVENNFARNKFFTIFAPLNHEM
jgi:hypothetical protein